MNATLPEDPAVLLCSPTAVVRAAVSAVVVNDRGRLLAGYRRDNGQLAFPGGSVVPGESLEEAVVREVREETGLDVRVAQFSQVNPQLFLVNHPPTEPEHDHFLVVFFEARVVGGTLTNCEPDKCAGWAWYSLNDLFGRLPTEAVRAWQDGKPHEGLCWIPLGPLAHYREHLGLV